MSQIKVKTQTRFMVLFTSGSSLTWGNLQALCMASSPGIYLPSTPNNQLFMLLQMTKFSFFNNKDDRWDYSMRAHWGSLSICPCLNHMELPYHTPGELLSIIHLKVWQDAQEPHGSMAYLLVHTEGSSEAGSYGMALVWISPHQAWASTMEEA